MKAVGIRVPRRCHTETEALVAKLAPALSMCYGRSCQPPTLAKAALLEVASSLLAMLTT